MSDSWADKAIEDMKASYEAELANLRDRIEELERAKWQQQHVDTMNDMASLRIALESAESKLGEARADMLRTQVNEDRYFFLKAKAAEERCAKLEKALEFYADDLTWADTNPKNDGRITVLVPSPSFAEIDSGKIARAALDKDKGGE